MENEALKMDLPRWLFDSAPSLQGTVFPRSKVVYRSAIPSTNSLAMTLLKEGAAEGTIVVTDHQTDGRGQKGSSWYASAGENLTFSLILRPQNLEKQLFHLSQAASLSLCEAIKNRCADADVRIKWPNDILMNRKKVAGILIESQWEGHAIKGTVVGIGVNVNQVSFPDGLRHPATSLRLACGRPMDRGQLIRDILERFSVLYERILHHISIERRYLNVLYGYQEPVALKWDSGEGRYPVLGVNEHGHVAIQLPEGIRHFDLKEIQFLLT